MQVKLLRAIEGGGYTPIGDRRVKQPDVRIIAATNRDLKQLVRQGTMRQDFFLSHPHPSHLDSSAAGAPQRHPFADLSFSSDVQR